MMVRQQGVMAVSWQSSTVVFQELNIKASTRHEERQLCACEYNRERKQSYYVCLRCDNVVAAKLKVGAEAYLLGFSKV